MLRAVVFWTAVLLVGGFATAYERKLLTEISALTLRSGAYTTGRRTSPVPQLTCTAGCDAFTPSTVRCTNKGTDGHDAQWDCHADLPSNLAFDKLDVSCEGYSHP